MKRYEVKLQKNWITDLDIIFFGKFFIKTEDNINKRLKKLFILQKITKNLKYLTKSQEIEVYYLTYDELLLIKEIIIKENNPCIPWFNSDDFLNNIDEYIRKIELTEKINKIKQR